jgi:hypothetical protein
MRVLGVVIDARASRHPERRGESIDHPVTRARLARWVAGNVLAATRRATATGALAEAVPAAGIVEWHVTSLTALLTAIAAYPTLVDGATLPRRWRAALRTLGVPLLACSPRDALAAGATIARVVTPQRMLAA